MYCLRNDLAQNVLWYNKSLMDQVGLPGPHHLGAVPGPGGQGGQGQHPGYIVGTAGDAWTPEIYMWGSECPASQVTGAKAITVNTSEPGLRPRGQDAGLPSSPNKTMSTQELFGPQFAKQQGGKVLMLPGPAWYGGAVFQGTLKTPKGQIAVAPALHWADESTPVDRHVGGGAWWVSAHSTNLRPRRKFATWVTTSDAYQVDLAPGYPAYKAAAAKWLAKQQSSGYWANDISRPDHRRGRPGLDRAGARPEFSQESVWARRCPPGMAQGKTDRVAAAGLADRHRPTRPRCFGYTVSK